VNISVLEKLARQALNGRNIVAKSNKMLNSGTITPIEHRSLQSLSWQIAANVQANGGTAAGTYAIGREPMAAWL
jgi:hypothetical protein